MAERKSYHVVPCDTSVFIWAVELEGEVVHKSRTKANAMEWAKMKARSRRHIGQVVEHDRNGVIKREFTYGADPVESEG